MKKQLSIALAALVLVACGGGSSDNNLINNITANNITGKWDGSFAGFTSSTTINGNVTMTLAQRDDGNTINGVSVGKIMIITGVYTTSSGGAGSVSGTFDGSSFTGSLTPSVATICPAKVVLFFSYNALNGTAVASNCAVSASAQGTFSKQ